MFGTCKDPGQPRWYRDVLRKLLLLVDYYITRFIWNLFGHWVACWSLAMMVHFQGSYGLILVVCACLYMRKGLDIKGVGLVVNFDAANNTEDYA